ncbi:winged helix family transcriptional regulator, partial [Clavibacter michiganensis]
MSLATIDPTRTALRSAPATPVLRAAAPLAPPARRPRAVPA